MSSMPDNVRQEIAKLVPASVVSDIACFVFFDGHPRDRKQIDIAVCTKFGELKEYFQRDLVSSLVLDIPKPSEITILRNDNADLFYLALGGDQLLILSRGENLRIEKRIRNVDKYEIEDNMCSGRARLKVYIKGDAVPLIFDENFETMEDICTEDLAEDSAPILTELMEKLTEAKYTVKCNEGMYEKCLNLRQLALFSKYQSVNSNACEPAFKNNIKEIACALKIDTQAPWVKICNKKVVVVFNITNLDEVPIQDIQILLHGTTRPAITYTTKLFEEINVSPFYKDKETNILKSNNTSSVTVVIGLSELKCNISSCINFDAVLMFKKKEKEFTLPLQNLTISSLDTLGEDFDVLNKANIDDPNTILAMLATTEKVNLSLRHIKNDGEEDVVLKDIFCSYLNMEPVPHVENVFIHRKSPYHTLHGVMVLIHDSLSSSNVFCISVFTRSPTQVLALIHFIYDAVPSKILITTPNYRIEAITNELCQYNEDTKEPTPNYTEYATSILNRTTALLKYLDTMMMKMNSSKNPSVQNKIGKEIHLFADGVTNYVEFRDRLLKEADEGVKKLMEPHKLSDECEAMVID